MLAVGGYTEDLGWVQGRSPGVTFITADPSSGVLASAPCQYRPSASAASVVSAVLPTEPNPSYFAAASRHGFLLVVTELSDRDSVVHVFTHREGVFSAVAEASTRGRAGCHVRSY
jgi:hypothetical protein